MITIVPDFYDQFSCKAGSCQHTCCQGWEIDIDEPTLYRYEKIKGEIGDKIRQSIIIRDGVFIFQLTDDDRCPLLQDDGLCQIIRTLGPKKLCKVCAMHPRFFVYKSELELAGLGLCCEKTCELLLERDTPLRFCIEGTDETMDFFELLKMTDIAKYLPRDCASQAMSILHATSSLTVSQILRIMELTEPINDSWCQLLAKIRQETTAGKLTLPPLETWPHDQQQAYDRFCQYILHDPVFVVISISKKLKKLLVLCLQQTTVGGRYHHITGIIIGTKLRHDLFHIVSAHLLYQDILILISYMGTVLCQIDDPARHLFKHMADAIILSATGHTEVIAPVRPLPDSI